MTAPKEALLPHMPLPTDGRQLLDAAAAQGEAAARERLLGRGLPAFVVEAMLEGRLPRRLGLMLSSSAPVAPVAEAPALTVAQEKERALKDMLFGLQRRQQQQREETETARVLRGMAEEERAQAARRRTWKAPLLFERMRGSGGNDDGKDRPGAAALTRRLRALLYGLVGMQGSVPVREEVLLADDTCVRMCTSVL